VGFSIGEVVYAGDWAFQAQYQWVGVASIPNEDASGIGLGNLYDLPYSNVNYKGWKFELLYALTDNITLDSIVESSNQITSKKYLGGKHSYSKFELEAIYAF
jgi:hypothetical protein